jgi:hypothetical protein
MTVVFETSTLTVIKLYYGILKFSRIDRRYVHVGEKVNKVLLFVKDTKAKQQREDSHQTI